MRGNDHLAKERVSGTVARPEASSLDRGRADYSQKIVASHRRSGQPMLSPIPITAKLFRFPTRDGRGRRVPIPQALPRSVARAAKQTVGITANMEPKGSPIDIVRSTTGTADQATAATTPNPHDATASRE
jgi:hypothetical protein